MPARSKAVLRALVALLLPAGASPQEATLRLSVLDNGGFEERGTEHVDDAGLRRVPWWRTTRGAPMVRGGARGVVLETLDDDRASQPLAMHGPLWRSLVVRGEVRGHGILALVDAEGRRAEVELEHAGEEPAAFELRGGELAERFGAEPVPRLVLELRAADEPPHAAHWARLEASIELPAPSPGELRAEIRGLLDGILATWLERGLDREGPVATGLLCHLHDVLTGERLTSFRGGFHPLFRQLALALEVEDVPAWSAALDAFVASYLERCLHPETALPRNWDPREDRPADEQWLEVAGPLGALIDLAEHGPERWRAPALDAALRAGETILARGVLPDGQVAARYRPADGAASTDAPPIRRLDVPAQLGRLAALGGDERFARAARRALEHLEYTHYWSGDWNHLDPGFDDHFGHFGARAFALWEALPGEEAYARFVVEGLEYYAPRWRDAVRLGGYVSADQVRAWEIVCRAARLDERVRAAAELLWPAARAHFKAQQHAGGAWSDLTHYRFEARPQLEVGDLPAIPQTLLHGLALLHDERLGTPLPELRAMYAAVLRATVERYRRPYGYLGTRAERRGPNPAGASLRLTTALVEMLRRLPR